MSERRRSENDRRTVENRRRVHDDEYLIYVWTDRRRWRERRSQIERRAGWERVSKWRSAPKPAFFKGVCGTRP